MCFYCALEMFTSCVEPEKQKKKITVKQKKNLYYFKIKC